MKALITSFHPADPDMPFKEKEFRFRFSLRSKNTPGVVGERDGWGGKGGSEVKDQEIIRPNNNVKAT